MDVIKNRRFWVATVALLLVTSLAPGQEAETPEGVVAKQIRVELTEPLPEKSAEETLPEGWNQERYSRADGLYFLDKRMTVRAFIEALKAQNLKGAELTIAVSPHVTFKRLQGVAYAVLSSESNVAKISWASLRRPRAIFPMTFVSNSTSRIRIENGTLFIGSMPLGEIGDELTKTFEDMAKKRQEAERTQVKLELRLANKSKPGEITWRLESKKLGEMKSSQRRTKLGDAITKKKDEEGSATLALAPNHLIRCGHVLEVFIAAQEAGAESTVITNGSGASSSMGFSWNTKDPGWLPQAIDNSLKALTRMQSPGGHWQTFMVGDIGNIGSTSLALLAFFGEFHTPEEGKYKDAVASGLQYLLRKQEEDGSLVGRTSGFSFDHVIGTYALIEAYGLVDDEELERAARKAFSYLLRCRNKVGVWGKSGSQARSDLVVTAWAAAAIKSADECEFDVPKGTKESIGKWIDGVTDSKSGRLATIQKDGPVTTLLGPADEFYGRHKESLTAIALFVKARCGREPTSDKTIAPGVGKLIASPPGSGGALGLPDLDYLLFGGLAMNAFPGSRWREWRTGLDSAIEGHLRKMGGGETRALRKMMNADPTELAMLSLCLEVSYRYSQNYKDDD